MERRKIIIGTYDTALRGPWTLASWEFPEPEPQTNMVEVPGRDGPLDLSTALTNGEPVYNASRELTVTLECSEGTYHDRVKLIREMVSELNGRRLQIILPDDPLHFAEGRVSVRKEYNDLAHCAVTVKAVCDPWRYKTTETVLTLGGVGRVALPNAGDRILVPTVTANFIDPPGTLTVGGQTWTLEDNGEYIIPDLKLRPGTTVLDYVLGFGNTLAIRYREAVL